MTRKSEVKRLLREIRDGEAPAAVVGGVKVYSGGVSPADLPGVPGDVVGGADEVVVLDSGTDLEAVAAEISGHMVGYSTREGGASGVGSGAGPTVGGDEAGGR